jgi:Ca2+-binding EF-hand superfamily protein
LNLEELKQGLSEIKNGEEILALMQAADTDKSGTINYTGMIKFFTNIQFLEFIAATLDA